jgi:hypothetical protein
MASISRKASRTLSAASPRMSATPTPWLSSVFIKCAAKFRQQERASPEMISVLFAGDAHDATREYVLKHYGRDVENCSVLIAPHRGRYSERSCNFIDHIKSKLTLFGNAPSNPWPTARGASGKSRRQQVTRPETSSWRSAQVPSTSTSNDRFAAALGADTANANSQGYVFLVTIHETAEVQRAAYELSLFDAPARTRSRRTQRRSDAGLGLRSIWRGFSTGRWSRHQ